MATLGGPAIPVSVQTGGQQQGGPAIPVAVVSDGRATQGGPAQPVYVVTSGPMQGGPALPVVVATGAQASQVMAGRAIPVYVVSGSLSSGVAPANTALPVVSGTTELGATLTTTDGTWTGTPAPTFTYQWKRNGVNIGGATNNTYVLVSADLGTTITATVTATNASGSASATSAGTAIPNWLLLDHFTTNQAAPLTSPRTCEPGPGTLTLTDTGNKLSIAGGILTPSGSSTGVRDPWVRNAAGNARAIGRCFSTRMTRISAFGGNANDNLAGWATTLVNPDTGQTYGLLWGTTGAILVQTATASITVAAAGTLVDNVYYDMRFALRSVGFFFMVGSTLLWVHDAGSDATLYPHVMMRNIASKPFALEDAIVVDLGALWATDYGIATTRNAVYSAGDVITATVDPLIEATFTAQTGVTKNIMARYTDDNNCLILRCDQGAGSIKVFEKVAGVETEKTGGTTTQTWTNGTSYRVVFTLQGSDVRAFVNNIAKNVAVSTFNAAATQAKVDHSGTNFIAWPRSPALPNFL